MPPRPLLRILLMMLAFNAAIRALPPDSTAFQPCNATEMLLAEAGILVASVDDWGINVARSWFGLPGYALPVEYQNIEITDPLFGAVPVAWLNPRHQQVMIDPLNYQMHLTPVFADSGFNFSRFDYYRGDYGFLNFAAIVAGDIAENIQWRLFGENLGYDGAYGLLGPNYAKLKESVVQNYFLDINKIGDPWHTGLGCSYQKFFPGMTTVSALGKAGAETVLSWNHAGRLKQYRASIYMTGERATSRGFLKIGGQLTNFLYNVHHDTTAYAFDAEAYQYSGMFRGDFNIWSGSLRIDIEPVLESVYVRHGDSRTRSHFRQSIRYGKEGRRLDVSAAFGSVNSNLTADITAEFRNLRGRLNLYTRSATDYFCYPLIYFTDLAGKSGANPPDDGFSALRQTLGLRLNFGRSHFDSRLDYTKAEFSAPFKETIESMHYTLQKETLNDVYLTESFDFNLPWQIRLKGRIVLTPRHFDDDQFLFQGWTRLTKEQWLFRDNLRLYISGELHYLKGPDRLFWFEQLQTQAAGNVNYYTNERLTVNGIIGARIGPFHIFYTIYNIEGRAFSALPGMPYRNRLKIFGVDWTFINL